jgi:hypothetical protein
VDDHGDGRWTVRQMLVYDSDSTIYYTKTGNEYKRNNRATDNAVQVITYEWHAALKSTRAAAWASIAGEGSIPTCTPSGAAKRPLPTPISRPRPSQGTKARSASSSDQ